MGRWFALNFRFKPQTPRYKSVLRFMKRGFAKRIRKQLFESSVRKSNEHVTREVKALNGDMRQRDEKLLQTMNTVLDAVRTNAGNSKASGSAEPQVAVEEPIVKENRMLMKGKSLLKFRRRLRRKILL